MHNPVSSTSYPPRRPAPMAPPAPTGILYDPPSWNAMLQSASKASFVFERIISGRYDLDPEPDKDWMLELTGTSSVLITASHATKHWRETRWKREDTGTAGLAWGLLRMADTPVLTTCYRAPEDPNYDSDSQFKDRITEAISKLRPSLVLDLHASCPNKPYQVDIGTMDGDSLGKHTEYHRQLAASLSAAGIDQLSDNYFSGAKNDTIIKHCAALGVPAMQLEINATLLPHPTCKENYPAVKKIIAGLSQFVLRVDH